MASQLTIQKRDAAMTDTATPAPLLDPATLDQADQAAANLRASIARKRQTRIDRTLAESELAEAQAEWGALAIADPPDADAVTILRTADLKCRTATAADADTDTELHTHATSLAALLNNLG